MGNNPQKIILDTNLWISFLISKDLSKLDQILFENKCKLIFSEALLDEFLTVIKRPKFRRFFNEEETEELLELIEEFADFIEVKSSVKVCRDPKDNFLLSLSKDSGAEFLITGDSDLPELGVFATTKIITINDFLNLKL